MQVLQLLLNGSTVFSLFGFFPATNVIMYQYSEILLSAYEELLLLFDCVPVV